MYGENKIVHRKMSIFANTVSLKDQKLAKKMK